MYQTLFIYFWLPWVFAAACAGDPGSIPRLGRSPGEGNGNPTPVSLPGKSHEQRSLEGCSPWGHKESGTTEQVTLTNRVFGKSHSHPHCHGSSPMKSSGRNIGSGLCLLAAVASAAVGAV